MLRRPFSIPIVVTEEEFSAVRELVGKVNSDPVRGKDTILPPGTILVTGADVTILGGAFVGSLQYQRGDFLLETCCDEGTRLHEVYEAVPMANLFDSIVVSTQN